VGHFPSKTVATFDLGATQRYGNFYRYKLQLIAVRDASANIWKGGEVKCIV
jgi:hypothetical protein